MKTNEVIEALQGGALLRTVRLEPTRPIEWRLFVGRRMGRQVAPAVVDELLVAGVVGYRNRDEVLIASHPDVIASCELQRRLDRPVPFGLGGR